MFTPKQKKIHNFSAGPCILPESVLQEAAQAVVDFNQTGLSILEISHRSKEYIAVMDEAIALVRELLSVPSDYEILFLHGGASLQFTMCVQNLLPVNGKANYINTGTWSTKAIKEAELFGEVAVIASSQDKNFNYIPKDYQIDEEASFLHITTNNTIFGTQYAQFPQSVIPMIADMSSDIMSRKIEVKDFDLIYAGAQKNIGPAGVTLVIVKKSVLGRTSRVIPTMLQYQTHIDGESMFNTPPCYPIYVCMLTLRWLKKLGGIEVIEAMNKEKAKLLYDEIDRNSLFEGTAAKEDRSLMNVTFVLKNPSLEEEFTKLANERALSGIKGHRSVGGFRASIYNAMPIESVMELVKAMQDFEQKHG